jgi:hypothetical protein
MLYRNWWIQKLWVGYVVITVWVISGLTVFPRYKIIAVVSGHTTLKYLVSPKQSNHMTEIF